MAARLGALFAGMANEARLRKFVSMSTLMLLIGGGLSGCAVPLREGLGSREGRLISPDRQIMLTQSATAKATAEHRVHVRIQARQEKKDA